MCHNTLYGWYFIIFITLAPHFLQLGRLRLKLNHWSVETDSTRQILVVGVINVHAYPSWIVFSGCIIPPDNKDIKLGSINQELSPSTGKNTGLVLMPCHIGKHGPSRSFVGVIISEVPGCYLWQQISSQLGLQKLLQEWMSHAPFYFWSLF